jgi:hypothetical protein
MHPTLISRDLAHENQNVLALPSYDRQRLRFVRRGWCPLRSRRMKGFVRTDVGETHRLSLSARVLSAGHGQVKAKPAFRYGAGRPAWRRSECREYRGKHGVCQPAMRRAEPPRAAPGARSRRRAHRIRIRRVRIGRIIGRSTQPSRFLANRQRARGDGSEFT